MTALSYVKRKLSILLTVSTLIKIIHICSVQHYLKKNCVYVEHDS
jgi:hypothetical protein